MSGENSLRGEIRGIVDKAEHRLTSAEIYGQLKRRSNLNVFSVTLSKMVDDRQLRKRKAPKSRRAGNIRLVYGPGPVPVSDRGERAPHISATKGFMQIARERRAKQRARKRAAV